MRYENVQELLKVRGNLLFSTILASSSCIITIIETSLDHDILNMIDMVNSFRAERKRLLLLIPTFNETMFKNIMINYDVTIEHSDGGDVNINV